MQTKTMTTSNKRVCFQNEVEIAPIPRWYVAGLRRCRDEKHHRRLQWWGGAEKAQIKTSVLELVDSVLDGCDAMWQNPERQSYYDTICQVHAACISEDEDQQELLSESLTQDLEYWMCAGHSRRGLESTIVEELCYLREKRKAQVRKAVFLVQRSCWENESLTEEESAHMIRTVSESLSLPGVTYAAILGFADAAAARNEYRRKPERRQRRSNQLPTSPKQQQQLLAALKDPESPQQTRFVSDSRLGEKRIGGPAAA
mmetsp:Transcript_20286/g.46974  ORF Transcript_20286/g.46974 Transcript_20286/m.46974 type:complete len:257 (+) Transcript_20286:95-865(+)